jgi:acetyl-CoA acetyltransferase
VGHESWVTLLHALVHRGGGKGVAALCVGGGMGIAMAVAVPGDSSAAERIA